MPYSKASGKATLRYKKRTYHRVALDLRHAEYDQLKEAADSVHETVGHFLKIAAQQKLEHMQNETRPEAK